MRVEVYLGVHEGGGERFHRVAPSLPGESPSDVLALMGCQRWLGLLIHRGAIRVPEGDSRVKRLARDPRVGVKCLKFRDMRRQTARGSRLIPALVNGPVERSKCALWNGRRNDNEVGRP